MRTVSHYEMIEKLGEGGMGVVWKGRDTRLDRFVAIKFLPPERTADPDRKRRFAQEAKAASALNHPRIITIYDIDHADGSDFIVMEYVAGKTLEQLIPPKGMKMADAVRYATQIADALAAAHAAGIVHRDLKPANVIVSDTGQVKVLDFGLAKLTEEASSSEVDNTRTIAELAKTEAGTIVGTTCYMSPEQAEGKKVDARSDIFSFGAVLYEMLTGKRAFQGDSKMSTLASILRGDPEPLDKLAVGAPRDLLRIVQRCLRKDPNDRAQSMADLRIALKEITEESESGLLVVPAATARKASRKGLWAGAAVAVLAVGGGAAYLLPWGKSAPEQPLQATQLTSYQGVERSPTFSPDGNQVAFAWNGEKGDNYDIYVSLLGTGKPLRLTTDPESDLSPSWSPDGRWIAFVRGDGIFVIPPLGGVERRVAQGAIRRVSQFGLSVPGSLVSWSPDGRWLVACMREPGALSEGIYLVSLENGEKRRLTTPPKGANGDFFGAISPDGKNLAFSRILLSGTDTMSDSDIYTMPLGSDYSPKGEPRPITADKVMTRGLAWTADSTELVFSSFKGGSMSLWRVGVSGAQKPVKMTVGESGSEPAISHSGRRLAYQQSRPADLNIWRSSISDASATPVSLIASTRPDQSPQYSPDGKKIAFSSERSGPNAIWVCDADGGNAVQLTTAGSSGSPSWSPDSQRIAFDHVTDAKWQIFTISAQGGTPRQLTSGPEAHTRPSWSHDGQWIYSTGGNAIVKTPSGGGTPVKLYSGGGTNPVESVDGKTIYWQRETIIWKAGTDGSSAGPLFDEPTFMNGIAVTGDGIYYQAARPDLRLMFFSFSTGRSRPIMRPGKLTGLGVTVSPDQKWILYCQRDAETTADLMLVDPFR
ncbi:MAG TPA: protein kinase [Candidatus Sulfopaludibacter sp.]|jgi:serine/threonine protein kinase|nr:protein kinase [Candidatus Sulfopaludibacter sp.]